jgi:hypothetical protein
MNNEKNADNFLRCRHRPGVARTIAPGKRRAYFRRRLQTTVETKTKAARNKMKT